MAPCMDPSSPTPSDLSVLEKQKIYLNQQHKQHLNQSAYIGNFSSLPVFKPIDEESSIAHDQVYNPIKSLVNGWTGFSMASLTSVVAGNSDTMREINMNRITENINKRKAESNVSLKITLLIHRSMDQIIVKMKSLRYLSWLMYFHNIFLSLCLGGAERWFRGRSRFK